MRPIIRSLPSRRSVRSISRRRLSLGFGVLVASLAIGAVRTASADAVPKAEVLVIHATKCDQKKVDPAIGDAPPSMGYDCLKLVRKETMPLPLGQPSTTKLPNGRTFQLLQRERVGSKYRVTASIDSPDGKFVELANITAEPNKPFNVGGFSHQGGVLLLTIKIAP